MNLKKPALLLLLPAFLCSAAEEKKENIPAIPVVKTYGDLLAAKPLLDVSLEEWKKAPPHEKGTGEGRVTIRVGIDRSKSDLNDAALLYCLVQAPVHIAVYPNLTGPACGPFKVEVQSPIIQTTCFIATKTARLESLITPNRLFLRSVPLTEEGEWKLHLEAAMLKNLLPVGKPLAEARVQVSAKNAPIWHPWNSDASSTQESQEADPRMDLKISGLAASASSSPCFPGRGDYEVYHLPDKIDPRVPLPTLFPSPDKVSIKAEAGPDLVILQIPNGCENFYPSLETILSRWWINGQPVSLVPVEKARAAGNLNSAVRVMELPYNAGLSFRFDADVFGAKEGDEIGLQILCCPHGFTSSNRAADVLAQQLEENAYPRLSWLSERKNFILRSGRLIPKADPATAAKKP